MAFKFIKETLASRLNLKTIVSLLAIVILANGLRLAIFTETEASRSLTEAEQLSLKRRAQQQRNSIISTDDPNALQLLLSRSREVDFNGAYIDTLITQMRLAVAANHGFGLAAVQIGIPVRVVLMKQEINDESEFKAYINPSILHKSKALQLSRESCLSLPNQEMHIVKRSLSLKISYQTGTGESVVEHLKGLEAAIFQQEIDHLNGVLLDKTL